MADEIAQPVIAGRGVGLEWIEVQTFETGDDVCSIGLEFEMAH